jgi:hypothetical protein
MCRLWQNGIHVEQILLCLLRQVSELRNVQEVGGGDRTCGLFVSQNGKHIKAGGVWRKYLVTAKIQTNIWLQQRYKRKWHS